MNRRRTFLVRLLRRRTIPIILPILLLAALAILLIFPWNGPIYDVELNGFNPDYVYQNPSGGTINLDRQSMMLNAPIHTMPTSIIATSQSSYSAIFDATLFSESNNSQPFTVSVYAPEVFMNATIGFFSGNHTITLYSPTVLLATLGTYAINRGSHVSIHINVANSILIEVSGQGKYASYLINNPEFHQLLIVGVRAIRVSADGGSGSGARVEVDNLELRIPHDPWLASKALDWRLLLAYPIVAAMALFTLIGSGLLSSSISLPGRVLDLGRRLPRSLWAILAIGLAFRIVLFQVGHHPYDIFVETLWTRSIINGGLGEIYQGPALATAAQAFNGIPYLSSSFPYPPFLAYLFYPVAGIRLASLGLLSIENSLKLASAFADLFASVFVYLTVQRLGVTGKTAIFSAGLYLMLPATIYDSAIWGETDSFMMLLLIITMFMYVAGRNGLFWAFATLSILTKQTAAIPILLMVVLFLISRGMIQTIRGLGVAVSVSLLVITPFIVSGYSPLLLISQIVSRFSEYTLGSTAFGQPISADAFSLPPLFSQFSGLVGRERMWSSDSGIFPPLSISYSNLGTLMFLAVAGPLTALFYPARKEPTGAKALAVVAAVTLISIFLPTRVSGRYFVIATGFMVAPFIALARKWMIPVIILVSTTTLISLHGLLVYIGEWIPNISMIDPYTPFNRGVESFYLSDFGITLSILLNLVAVVATIIALPGLPSLATLKRELVFRRTTRN